MEHGVVGNDVFAFRFPTHVPEEWINRFDFFPEHIEVDDQILDDGHHSSGLYRYDAVLHHRVGDGFAGQTGVSVDSHGAGTADGTTA